MTQPAIPTTLDRLLTAVRSIIRAEFPQFDYAGTFEYSIQAAMSSSVDCSPTDTTLPLPSLTGLPMRPGLLGETVTLKAGARCLVQFINRDPTRPVIVGADPIPITSTIDATGALVLGPSSQSVAIAGGADALVVGPAYLALLTELEAAATATASAATSLAAALSPFVPATAQTAATALAVAQTAMVTAIGALPFPLTLKTTAT